MVMVMTMMMVMMMMMMMMMARGTVGRVDTSDQDRDLAALAADALVCNIYCIAILQYYIILYILQYILYIGHSGHRCSSMQTGSHFALQNFRCITLSPVNVPLNTVPQITLSPMH